MKRLNTIQLFIMDVGGVLMLVSLVGRIFWPDLVSLFTYSVMYVCGSLGFGCMQMMQRYEGTSLTLHRLRSIQVTADLLFILTGLFMLLPFMGVFHIPVLNITTWRNEWLVILVTGAILELYSMLRMAHELGKDDRK